MVMADAVFQFRGRRRPGMGRSRGSFPVARQVFEEADDALGSISPSV